MKYPILKKTPIKEIIFSLTFVDEKIIESYNEFVKSIEIKSNFSVEPLFVIKFNNSGTSIEEKPVGYRLKNKNEVIHLKDGLFSYHNLNNYNGFEDMFLNLFKFWDRLLSFNSQKMNISSISIRYINQFEINDDYPESRLIQIYPKYSSDREIKNFQNIVNFSFNDFKDIEVNIVSTKPKEDSLILDISTKKSIDKIYSSKEELKKDFEELREIKNRAFFDSITAKALIKYI